MRSRIPLVLTAILTMLAYSTFIPVSSKKDNYLNKVASAFDIGGVASADEIVAPLSQQQAQEVIDNKLRALESANTIDGYVMNPRITDTTHANATFWTADSQVDTIFKYGGTIRDITDIILAAGSTVPHFFAPPGDALSIEQSIEGALSDIPKPITSIGQSVYSANISWEPIPGATSYDTYAFNLTKGGSPAIGTTTSNGFIFNTVEPGVYLLAARANNTNNGPWSDPLVVHARVGLPQVIGALEIAAGRLPGVEGVDLGYAVQGLKAMSGLPSK
ncbi:MAG: hypothetical protein ABIJ08_06860 [Nanoarchaeota archaeon]